MTLSILESVCVLPSYALPLYVGISLLATEFVLILSPVLRLSPRSNTSPARSAVSISTPITEAGIYLSLPISLSLRIARPPQLTDEHASPSHLISPRQRQSFLSFLSPLHTFTAFNDEITKLP